jgi:hypothetical protein
VSKWPVTRSGVSGGDYIAEYLQAQVAPTIGKGPSNTPRAEALITPETLHSLLTSVVSPSALQIVDLILALDAEAVVTGGGAATIIKKVQEMLQGFDGSYTVSAAQPVIVEAIRATLTERLRKVLGNSAGPVLGGGFSAFARLTPNLRRDVSWMLSTVSSTSASSYANLISVLREQESLAEEQAVLGLAVVDAYHHCEALLGSNSGRWTWGQVHNMQYRSVAMMNKQNRVVGETLSRGPLSVPGGLDTVLRSEYDRGALTYLPDLDVFEANGRAFSSSLRIIVDLGRKDGSYWASQPVGQSGRMGSRWFSRQAPYRWWADSTSSRLEVLQGSAIAENGGSKVVHGTTSKVGLKGPPAGSLRRFGRSDSDSLREGEL